VFGLCVFLICSRYRTEAGWQRSPCQVAVLQVETFQDGLEVMFLRDVEFPHQSVSVDVEPEEVASRSRVGAFELRIEFALELVEGRPVVASDE
jgi:hypothetical protein